MDRTSPTTSVTPASGETGPGRSLGPSAATGAPCRRVLSGVGRGHHDEVPHGDLAGQPDVGRSLGETRPRKAPGWLTISRVSGVPPPGPPAARPATDVLVRGHRDGEVVEREPCHATTPELRQGLGGELSKAVLDCAVVPWMNSSAVRRRRLRSSRATQACDVGSAVVARVEPAHHVAAKFFCSHRPAEVVTGLAEDQVDEREHEILNSFDPTAPMMPAAHRPTLGQPAHLARQPVGSSVTTATDDLVGGTRREGATRAAVLRRIQEQPWPFPVPRQGYLDDDLAASPAAAAPPAVIELRWPVISTVSCSTIPASSRPAGRRSSSPPLRASPTSRTGTPRRVRPGPAWRCEQCRW